MNPHQAPSASGENLSQEALPPRAWWQDALSAPTPLDDAEPARAAAEGGFVHEKWWIEEAVERATGCE
jgi:hypothetical protein